jgi:Zn-dependent protease with chaperone function
MHSESSWIELEDSEIREPEPIDFSNSLLDALKFVVPQTRVSAGYGIAMGLLSIWLLMIPLFYVALLAFLGYLVVWHAYEVFETFSQGPYFVFHVPMAFLGGLLLVFLIKPVFFRRKGKSGQVLTLNEADEPLLYEYVRRLSVATGSRAPTRIEVDCEPNAAARLDRGFRSVFSRNMVLRIGLPLVADLSVRQLTGVIAHELGHFKQRHGMSGAYLIRRTTFFFAQIVFQRDRLDETLLRFRRSNEGVRQLIYWIVIGPIEAARGVLWLMLVLGELLACGVLRRMEFDADRSEALVAGTRDFISTTHAITFLQIASRRARHDLAEAWEQRRLADNLPRLIVANGRQLAESRADILAALDREKTRWFDTHPSHKERIRAVERLGAAGLLQLDAVADHLFADFDALCRRATDAMYYSLLKKSYAEAKLIPTAELVEERLSQRAAYDALNRFLRGHVIAMQPVLPGPDAHLPVEIGEDVIALLAEARRAMLAMAESMGPVSKGFERDAKTMAVARAQVALCDIFSRNPKVASIRNRAHATLRQTAPPHVEARRRHQAFVDLSRHRLTTALRLLNSDEPAVAWKEDCGDPRERRRRAGELVGVCRSLEPQLALVDKLRELTIHIRVLASAYNPRQPYTPLANKILSATNEAAEILRQLKHDLEDVPFPFAHATENISIGATLVQKFPDQRDPIDSHACALAAIDAFYGLLFRTLAELAQIAEGIEVAIGLEALPAPLSPAEVIDQATGRVSARQYWIGYGVRAAAGVAMLAVLIWLSIDPPVLPAGLWGSGAYPGGYQPNSFRMPFSAPPQYPTIPGVAGGRWQRPGSMAPGFPAPGMPQRPGFPPPGYSQPLGSRQAPGFPQHPGYPSSPWRSQPAPNNPNPYGSHSFGGGAPGGYSPGGGRSGGGGGGRR